MFQPIGLTVEEGFSRHRLFAFRLDCIQHQQTITRTNSRQTIDHKTSAGVTFEGRVHMSFNDFQASTLPFIDRSRPGLVSINLVKQGLGWKAEIQKTILFA